jgi:hypothetical protein
MSALLDRYRVYLIHPDGTPTTYEVASGSKELAQDDLPSQLAPQEGQLFFRHTLRGGILLRGAAFAWVYALEQSDGRCTPIEIEVYKIVPGGTDTLDFAGNAAFDQMDFFVDRCEVTLQTESIDTYSDLVRIWEKPVNLLDGTAKVGVVTNYKDLAGGAVSFFEDFATEETIAISAPGGQTFSDPDFPDPDEGWVMVTDTVVIIDSGGLFAKRTTVWMREMAVAFWDNNPTFPPGEEWKVVENTAPGVFRYARPVESVFMEQESITQVHTFGTLPLIWTFDAYAHKYQYVPYHTPTIDNGVRLSTAFTKLLSGTGFTLKSNFYNINPAGASPPNDVYADPTDHENRIVFHPSDVLRPNASNNATILETSLKEFLEELNYLDQVWVTVLPGKVLQLEHQSFYEGNQGIDFTQSPYDRALVGNHRYRYDRDNLPIGDRFFHADEAASLLPFKKYQYSYDIPPAHPAYPNCVFAYGPYKEYIAGNSRNDIMAMIANPHTFSTDGFTFVDALEINGSLVVPSGRFFDGYPFAHLNNHMTPWYLANELYVHNRFFPAAIHIPADGTGTINLFFESWRKYKRQVPLAIPMRGDISAFDPLELQQSQIGWGQVVDAVEYSRKTGILTVNLLHD